jgi:hypothetical protein
MTKKYLLPTLALASLATLTIQNAQAAANFSSYATVTYTIDSLSNLTNAGDFSGLDIGGSFVLAPNGVSQYITGTGSVTASAFDAEPTAITAAVGSSYTRTFQLDGSASNNGFVFTNYLAYFDTAFSNLSATDSYNVGLTLSYTLSASATGDEALTDVVVNYSAEHYNAAFDMTADPTFFGADYAGTNQSLSTAFLLNSQAFNFTLAPGEFEALYASAGINGTLQASPVPLPSAVWLFASALLAIPGLKKATKTA